MYLPARAEFVWEKHANLAVAPTGTKNNSELVIELRPYDYRPRRNLHRECSGRSSLLCKVREDLAVTRVEGLRDMR